MNVPTLKQAKLLLTQHAEPGEIMGCFVIDAAGVAAMFDDWADEVARAQDEGRPTKLNSLWRKRHAIKYVTEDEVEA